DEGLALDLDSGEAAVMIGEFAGLAVVRQSPQAGALGVLAVLASAFGGEDDRAVLAQGHGADGLVTAGDAAGPLTAGVGERREVGVLRGGAEGVLGDDATALIRQETLQAGGGDESGQSVDGRSSCFHPSSQPGIWDGPGGKLPDVPEGPRSCSTSRKTI